jgi:uncharacterized membrane protein
MLLCGKSDFKTLLKTRNANRGLIFAGLFNVMFEKSNAEIKELTHLSEMDKVELRVSEFGGSLLLVSTMAGATISIWGLLLVQQLLGHRVYDLHEGLRCM